MKSCYKILQNKFKKKSYEQHFKLKSLKTHSKSIISFCLHESYKLRNSVVISDTSTTWLQDDKSKIRLMRIYKVPVNKSETFVPSWDTLYISLLTPLIKWLFIHGSNNNKQYIHHSLTDVGLPISCSNDMPRIRQLLLNLVEVKMLRKCEEFPEGDGVFDILGETFE